MKSGTWKKNHFAFVIVLTIFVFLFFFLLYSFKKEKKVLIENKTIEDYTVKKIELPKEEKIVLEKPEISGWIAWWIEQDGYDVVDEYHESIFSVSPGWLNLKKTGTLTEIGKVNKQEFSQTAKNYSNKLYPMLITEFSDKELALFIRDQNKLQTFLESVISKLQEYEADGLDLDFENIGEEYMTDFSFLVRKLSEKLHENDFRLSVTIQAQNGKDSWKGIKGQDIPLIGEYADEVRIMIYDRHGDFSQPGPVTPMDWFIDVLEYNLELIPREKIVVALPSYGYIWMKNGDFKSFQYKDFVEYARKNKLEGLRDSSSFELKYDNKNLTGFLSDAESVIKKMEYARNKGINRFAIWNFSGTDEKLFQKEWESLEISIPNSK